MSIRSGSDSSAIALAHGISPGQLESLVIVRTQDTKGSNT
jgi:hypothetical protein